MHRHGVRVRPRGKRGAGDFAQLAGGRVDRKYRYAAGGVHVVGDEGEVFRQWLGARVRGVGTRLVLGEVRHAVAVLVERGVGGVIGVQAIRRLPAVMHTVQVVVAEIG